MSKNTSTDTAAIDAAINKAKAKASGNSDATEKPKRAKLTPEQRTERLAAYEKAKAERATARAAKKAAKQAERQATRAANPPHMAKVNKAAEALPSLSEGAQGFFSKLTSKLSPAEIFALSENLSHHVRAERTKASASMALNEGDKVKILSGSPKHVGSTGTVTKAQRIRCFVDVGEAKPVYLFNADVEVTEAAQIQSVPEDSDEALAKAS